MTFFSIVAWKAALFQSQRQGPRLGAASSIAHYPPDLHSLWQQTDALPHWVTTCSTAMRYLNMLGPLAWHHFPERSLENPAPTAVIPYAALCAAMLLKLEEGLVSVGSLRRYLLEHPALLWLLGFPILPDRHFRHGFDADASLPTPRHLTRMLRQMPNAIPQFLLDSTVSLLAAELAEVGFTLGDSISLDTKHILAWVRENNHKEFISDRFDKNKQPKGDPDCRLGCKRRRNQRISSQDPPPTPTSEPLPAHNLSVGEFYWGYASGVVAAKIDNWGEFVLAELTQPFDRSDVSYFFPLMNDAARRLGRRPRFGAFDAAFDAFYVYEYFHEAGGFAAVPWSDRASHRKQFSEEGLPFCPADLPMPRAGTFMKRSHCLVPHRRVRYACPLKYPQPNGNSCPIQHKNWAKKGCVTTLPDSPGVRVRHELDRHDDAYKDVYRQRTATERINSQAVALGIERPKLRNGKAIANINSLIYVLINLRALHRVRQQRRSAPAP